MTNRLAWGAKVSPEFRRKVIALAAEHACDPSWFMACIAFETGETFSAKAINPNSSATGLIQFMTGPGSWAAARDYTRERLMAMTDEEQLDLVREYFEPYRGRLKTLSDVYMAILWPKAVGASENAVIFYGPDSREYLANRGLDVDHDNAVTKAEAASLVAAKLAKGAGFATDESVPVQQETVPIVTPPKEPRMGATLLAGLIPSILSLFSGRAQAAIQKATGVDADVAAKFTADIAKQIEVVSGVPVTDAPSAMRAAAAVAGDPVKVKALEDYATGFVLAEIGGGVQSAAEEYAAINKDLDDDPWYMPPIKFLFNMQNVVTLAFLAGVGYFVPPLARKVDSMSAEAAMGLIVLIFAVIGVVSGRWLRLTPKEKE